MVNRHTEIPERFPYGVLSRGHPDISDVKCHWTHGGDWVKMPIDRTTRLKAGDDNYEVVRIESYIDEEGEIRKGVCYTKGCPYLWASHYWANL